MLHGWMDPYTIESLRLTRTLGVLVSGASLPLDTASVRRAKSPVLDLSMTAILDQELISECGASIMAAEIIDYLENDSL